MTSAATATFYRRNMSLRRTEKAVRTVSALCGIMLAVTGALLAVYGYVSPLEAPPFSIFAGFGLIVAGGLVARRNRLGLWSYGLMFAGTLAWSVRNVDSGGSSLAYRLVGQAILAAIFSTLTPPLFRWRARRSVLLFAGLLVLTIGLGMSSAANGPLAGPATTVTHFLAAESKGALQ